MPTAVVTPSRDATVQHTRRQRNQPHADALIKHRQLHLAALQVLGWSRTFASGPAGATSITSARQHSMGRSPLRCRAPPDRLFRAQKPLTERGDTPPKLASTRSAGTAVVPAGPAKAAGHIAGLACLIPVVLLRAVPVPVSAGLALAFAAGVISVAELGLIYLALQRGPVIVMAPITAVGAALPVTAGITTGDRVTAIIGRGLACCLAGAVIMDPPILIGVAARTAADPLWVIGSVRACGVITSLLWLRAFAGTQPPRLESWHSPSR